MAALPRSGDAFAGHRIEDEIGRGGMGVVFRATNRELHRERAIKVIAPEHSANPVYAARFQRESRLAAAVEHPNVVPIHAAGEDRELLFIVMRLVEGPDLDRLLRGGPMPPGRAIGILRQVAGALDAAHEAGLVHRDIKPGNVLVEDRDGADHVYLTDFGVSKRSAEPSETDRQTGLTIDGQVLGTAAYLSPEQIERGSSDRRADVYSLACVAFHVLSGRPPFPRETELGTLVAHAREPRPAASAVNPELGPAVDGVLETGMAIDPDSRPASAAELVAEVEAAISAPRRGRVSRSASRPGRLRRLTPLAAALLLAGVAVAVLVILGSGDESPGPAPSPQGRSTPEVTTVPLPDGSSPVGVAVDGGTAFVASRDAPRAGSGTVGAIDLITIASGEIDGRPVPVPTPRAIATDDGTLWAASGDAVYRVDPGSDQQRIETGGKPDDVAVTSDGAWISDEESGSVSRFDAASGAPSGPPVPVGDEPRSIAATPDAAWVAVAGEGVVAHVGADSMEVEREIPVGPRPTSIAVGGGSVWVADNAENTVREIDPRTGEVVGEPITVAPSPRGVAYGAGSVWVASGSANVLERFDPRTRERIGRPVQVGADPADVTAAGSTVITADQAGDSVSIIRP